LCQNGFQQEAQLSYRRETARQLPTWRGLGPSAHSPSAPSAALLCDAYMVETVESETRNKRTSSAACRPLSTL